MDTVRRGIIKSLIGTWGSGIAELIIVPVLKTGKPSKGKCYMIPCENTTTVRALDACFGNVIGEGHCINPKGGHINKEVFYSLDEFGMLLGFTPVNEASDELVEAWRNKA